MSHFVVSLVSPIVDTFLESLCKVFGIKNKDEKTLENLLKVTKQKYETRPM